MRFQRLDLNLLVALDALLTEKSVSVAADRICLSQSATSSALGRLREYFGDDLLVQKGRKMVLTARAEELADPVRDVLQQIRTRIAETPEFDPAVTDRTITIMASDYTTEVLLSRMIKDANDQAPDMSFVIRLMNDNATTMLDRGDVDLLVTIDIALTNEHPCETLFQDNYVVMGWDQNPALANGIDEDTYFRMGHIMTNFGTGRIPAFEEWFLRSQSKQRRVEIAAPSFLSVPFLLVGSNRIATVHKRLAIRMAKQLPLKVVEIPFEIPPIRQAVQWHRANDADECLAWVVQQMKQAAASDEKLVTDSDMLKRQLDSAGGPASFPGGGRPPH
ncbi:MAG: LysR family transcriptional regulator [Rhodospirillaceae bacterium]|nr:LysR family transcriptional regulator [Rhodospirillaceae bacterium]